MEKKVVVISLGGSVIVPKEIDLEFLERFKRIILKNNKKYKFIIVCGGGKIARTYMEALENKNFKNKIFLQSLLGISVTRLNARLLNYLFDIDPEKGIPHEIKDIEQRLKTQDIIFTGGLIYEKEETSDSSSAKLARHFNSSFINITNVRGLFDKDPKKFMNARFIPEIDHKDFYYIAKKIEFRPGQHFVLDKKAADTIKKYNIDTYIIGPDMKNFDDLLNKRHFIGTIISKG